MKQKQTSSILPGILFAALSNATNNIAECGVDKDTVWGIFDWIKPLYFSGQ